VGNLALHAGQTCCIAAVAVRENIESVTARSEKEFKMFCFAFCIKIKNEAALLFEFFNDPPTPSSNRSSLDDALPAHKWISMKTC
jgi:hypothetical protein